MEAPYHRPSGVRDRAPRSLCRLLAWPCPSWPGAAFSSLTVVRDFPGQAPCCRDLFRGNPM